jgi:hypothetical protein
MRVYGRVKEHLELDRSEWSVVGLLSGKHISISYMHSAMGGGAVLENQSLRA